LHCANIVVVPRMRKLFDNLHRHLLLSFAGSRGNMWTASLLHCGRCILQMVQGLGLDLLVSGGPFPEQSSTLLLGLPIFSNLE